MKVLVCNPETARRMIRRRRRLGISRYDEVWDGVYVMSPEPNPEHSILVAMLSHIFLSAIDPTRLISVGASGNVSDRREGWTKNYRSPDILVFTGGTSAETHESHWFGGPDFAVEIVSPGDRSRKKFDFYAKVGVRELLLIDRKPWRLELYRPTGDKLVRVGTSDPAHPAAFTSQVLDLTFRLVPAQPRPQVEIANPADGRAWLA